MAVDRPQKPVCASCSSCALYSQKSDPIASELRPGSIMFVGAFPGTGEMDTGRPFTGASGKELMDALRFAGLERKDVSLTSVIACYPPGADLSSVNRRVKRHNASKNVGHGANKGVSPLQEPATACAGRFRKDVEGYYHFIALGNEAARALCGEDISVDELRGCIKHVRYGGRNIQVGFAYNPARVLHDTANRSVFQSDIRKLVAILSGKLVYKPGRVLIPDSMEKVHKGIDWLIAQHKVTGRPLVVDVETDGKNPLSDNCRCVGFCIDGTAVVIPLRKIDGTLPFGEAAYFDTVDHLRVLFRECDVYGHNAGQFDRLVLEQLVQEAVIPVRDTLTEHVLVNNEIRHSLGFVTSLLTANHDPWKAEHTATTAQTDMDLMVYCGRDCQNTEEIGKILPGLIAAHGQKHLVERERILQDIGCRMSRLGLRVDLQKAREMQHVKELESARLLLELRRLTSATFSPRSRDQVADWLYEDQRLSPPHYSEETGAPSTDDEALRTMLIKYALTADQRSFLLALRKFRSVEKLLGTYLRPMRLCTDIYKTPSGEERYGLVGFDGRLHPMYNRLPASGRYSSSDPNAQNIPSELRVVFIPEEGHVFVGCDSEALELRFVAEEAEAHGLLAIMNDPKLDVHNETMEKVYGPGIWKLPGAPSNRKKKGEPASVFYNTRGLLKNIRYAWVYAGGVLAIWQQVTSAEDEKGNLIYADKTPEDVREVMQGLGRTDPEIPRWWGKVRNEFNQRKFLTDRIWGRRRDFTTGGKINELVNHPIQAGGFHLVAEAMIQLVMGKQDWFATRTRDAEVSFDPELFAFKPSKRTGLITQTHDSVIFEVPEERGEEARAAVEACMTRLTQRALIPFTAEAKIGKNWEEV